MFKLVLSEDNITSRKEYLQERKLLTIQIEEPELIMPQARKFFVKRKIDLEDFGKLKRK